MRKSNVCEPGITDTVTVHCSGETGVGVLQFGSPGPMFIAAKPWLGLPGSIVMPSDPVAGEM